MFPASGHSGAMLLCSFAKALTVTFHLHASLTLSLSEGLSTSLQLGFLSPELAHRDSSSRKQVSSYSKKWDSVGWQQDGKYRQI